MKRREFLTNLCKAAAIATVVPTAIIAAGKGKAFTLPFKEDWIQEYPLTPDECFAPIIKSSMRIKDINGEWRNYTISWNYTSVFDGPFRPELYDKVEGEENTYTPKEAPYKGHLYDGTNLWLDMTNNQLTVGPCKLS